MQDKKYLNGLGLFYLWKKIIAEDEGVRKGIKLSLDGNDLILSTTTNNGKTKEENSRIDLTAIVGPGGDVFVKGIKEGDKILDLNDKLLSTSLKLEKVGNNINLVGKNNEIISTISATIDIAKQVENNLSISLSPSSGESLTPAETYNYNGSKKVDINFEGFTNKEIDDLINTIK